MPTATSPTVRDLLLGPARAARSFYRQQQRQRTLKAAVAGIRGLPPGTLPEHDLIDSLQRGWGNLGYAGKHILLERLARMALTLDGPVLECGPGVSTILLGLMTQDRGVEICSLEHDPTWFDLTRRRFEALGLDNVRVVHAPLVEHDGYHWYDIRDARLPSGIRLVVCDGPPESTTPGGRYGLVPVMGERLDARTTLVVDDAATESGVAMRERWRAESGWDGDLISAEGTAIAILRNPAGRDAGA